MKKEIKRFIPAIVFLVAFVAWTVLVSLVDLQAIGPQESVVGFAGINGAFHKFTGVHMAIYSITDWLGLVPIFICMIFGGIGFGQLIKRRSLLKVDFDIIVLGIYYVIVIFGYLIFEMISFSFRFVNSVKE